LQLGIAEVASRSRGDSCTSRHAARGERHTARTGLLLASVGELLVGPFCHRWHLCDKRDDVPDRGIIKAHLLSMSSNQ